MICIADSGGCENGINAQYARRAKLDIYILDPAYYTEAQAQMVNGTDLAFLEYVNLPCNFKGKVIDVRF